MLSNVEERIRKLTPRAEFFVVVIGTLGYYIITSAIVLLLRLDHYEMTTGRMLRAVLMESTLLLFAAWLLRIRGWSVERAGLRPSWLAGLAGIPLLIAYLTLYYSAYFAIRIAFPAASFHAIRMTVTASVPIMILTIIVNSFFEELIVTSYVIESLSSQGAAYAISASILLRFLYHLYQGPIASISILPLGFLFGAIFWRWRNVTPMIVAHTLANFIAFGFAAR